MQQMQQMQQQQQQQQQQATQVYAITAPKNEIILHESSQTQSMSSEKESDRDYRIPPSYPIVEYSEDRAPLTGNIVIQTTTSVPDGYLLCDGSEISREKESMLFNVVGTFYGNGDGSTTFCLPDLEDEDNPTHHYIIKQ